VLIFLAAGTSTLVFAANLAKPGDTLFPVQKLQNDIVLSLPLPEATKQQIRTNIAIQRVSELDPVKTSEKLDEKKIHAQIQESNLSIDAAIATLPKPPQAPAKKSNHKAHALLNQLDDLSNAQEKHLEDLKAKVLDADLKLEIEASIEKAKTRREKLHKSLEDSQENSSSQKNQSEDHKNPGTTSGSHIEGVNQNTKFKISPEPLLPLLNPDLQKTSD
jgi:hypothetical protein